MTSFVCLVNTAHVHMCVHVPVYCQPHSAHTRLSPMRNHMFFLSTKATRAVQVVGHTMFAGIQDFCCILYVRTCNRVTATGRWNISNELISSPVGCHCTLRDDFRYHIT